MKIEPLHFWRVPSCWSVSSICRWCGTRRDGAVARWQWRIPPVPTPRKWDSRWARRRLPLRTTPWAYSPWKSFIKLTKLRLHQDDTKAEKHKIVTGPHLSRCGKKKWVIVAFKTRKRRRRRRRRRSEALIFNRSAAKSLAEWRQVCSVTCEWSNDSQREVTSVWMTMQLTNVTHLCRARHVTHSRAPLAPPHHLNHGKSRCHHETWDVKVKTGSCIGVEQRQAKSWILFQRIDQKTVCFVSCSSWSFEIRNLVEDKNSRHCRTLGLNLITLVVWVVSIVLIFLLRHRGGCRFFWIMELQ